MTEKLKYVCDNHRHLVCVPYSIENLHKMAVDLNIKRCWFHKNHYDIPKKRIEEIKAKCIVVDRRNIFEIIQSPEYAEIIIGPEMKKTMKKPSNQVLPEHETLKYNGYIN